MITQQRIPISAVSLRIKGKWKPLKRSGDNFWQPAFTYWKQARSFMHLGFTGFNTIGARLFKCQLPINTRAAELRQQRWALRHSCDPRPA